ncbi:hypothetical protein [Deinococcus marmoris]|uniref:hypothetical protein n=1 Tax=Deinococcus marmoris TaxID=249408 RepID=UPI00054F72F1|nr:hypothetical protein [Deinococcus marmoris]
MKWIFPQPFAVASPLTIEEGQRRLAAAITTDRGVLATASSSRFLGEVFAQTLRIRRNPGLLGARQVLFEYTGHIESASSRHQSGLMMIGEFQIDRNSRRAFVVYTALSLVILIIGLLGPWWADSSDFALSLVIFAIGLWVFLIFSFWLMLLTSRPHLSEIRVFLLETLEGTELTRTT